jgi:DNA-binding GntR family transcriptional regulator
VASVIARVTARLPSHVTAKGHVSLPLPMVKTGEHRMREAASGSPAMLKRTGAKSLAEQAYELLEEKIITLQLEPGSLISEVVLVKECDIGRTPVREALQKLVQTGLVTILPHKGVLISEVNALKQLRLMEFRQVSEQLMVRCAAIRSTREQKKAFLELADKLDQAGSENDDRNFMRYDNELHLSIAQAANNEYLYRAMEIYNSLSRRFWYMHNKESFDLPYCAALHADLVRQIATGNPEKAVAAHDKLVNYILEVLRASLAL